MVEITTRKGYRCSKCEGAIAPQSYQPKLKVYRCWKCKIDISPDSPQYPITKVAQNYKRKVIERDVLMNIIMDTDDLKLRAYLATLYLTAARANEITRPNFIYKKQIGDIIDRTCLCKHKKDEHSEMDCNVVSCTCKRFNGRRWFVVRQVRVLKTKRPKYTDRISRYDYDHDFIKILKMYLQYLPDEKPLFTWHRSIPYRYMQSYGYNLHCIRICRTNDFIRQYQWDSSKLRRVVGWENAQTAEKYIHLNQEDIMDMTK